MVVPMIPEDEGAYLGGIRDNVWFVISTAHVFAYTKGLGYS